MELLVRFRLFGDEAEALRRLASAELRNEREQARFIIRQELIERGLLPDPQPAQANGQAVQND